MFINFHRSLFSAFIMVAMSVGFLAACEAEFSPINEKEAQYSIYGSLDVDQQQNYIRVKNLNIPFANDTASGLDADVSLQNLNTGTSEMLRDSTIEIASVNTVVFITDMNIMPETDYLATVRDASGREVTAQTRTPGTVNQVTLDPPQIRCGDSFSVVFSPVASQEVIDARISLGKVFDDSTSVYQRASKEAVQKASVTKRVVDLFIAKYGFPDRDSYQDNACELLPNEFISIVYTHFGTDPDSSTTSDSVDVPGGTGDFLGFYRDTLQLELDITDH